MADCEKAVPSVSRADDGKEEDEEQEHGGNRRRRRRSGYYKQVLLLAYQSYGVVYGDLSTSPLYVYNSTFTGALRRHQDEDAIFGVFSLIFWTLTLIPLLKYVIVVLSADDDGEGGTLALYSLLIRHAKFSLLPDRQAADEELSTYYKPGYVAEDSRRSSALKQFLEKHEKSGTFLLLMVLFGASLLIGDGVLTPAISVLSSFSGLQLRAKGLKDGDVVLLACVVLVCLFAVQHWGTQRVGFLFAPVVIVWLLAMGAIGFYNVVAWNPRVLRALSPHYVLRFFRRTHTDGWIALGGVMLSMTGTEAMFADLGHFTAASIRVAFVGLIYPCLVLQYMGQAAFLSKCNCDIHLVFFESIPEPVFWPVLVVAMLAAIVGSQAVISATFSIVKQCTALGCFPRVKVVHTSRRIYGQVYIPEINWMLMVLCLAVTVGFRDTALIGNAYGLACAGVMVVTTLLMALVIVFVWQMSSVLAVAFLLVFGSVEAAYASAAVMKVPQGGWLPLALSLVVVAVMYVWHYGTRRKYMFDVENRVSMKWIHALGPSLGIVRVPGIGLVYTELAHGVPAAFSHFVTNLPAFHQVLVFVCVKAVPVPRVRAAERCLVGRVGPRKHRMYRCVIRYGYKDAPRGDDNFENDLVLRVAEFIEMEAAEAASAPASASGRCSAASSADGRMAVVTRPGLGLVVQEADEAYTTLHATGASSPEVAVQPLQTLYEAESPGLANQRRVRFVLADNVAVSAKRAADPLVKEELAALVEAKHAGVAYIMGQSQIKARRTSSVVNKLAIDVVYNFLRRNSRGPAVALNIPHINLIQVGMVYYV